MVLLSSHVVGCSVTTLAGCGVPLTYEQIWAAANDLEASGVEATLVAVRKALGGGSYSTLSDAMAERRKHLPMKGMDAKEPLPPALSQLAERLGQHIWMSAIMNAHDRLKSDREQFDRMRSDLEAQRTEAAAVASEATADLEAAQRRIKALEVEARVLRDEIHDMRAKLAAATARGGESDRRTGDLNRELERVNEANASLIGLVRGLGQDPHAERPGKRSGAASSKAP